MNGQLSTMTTKTLGYREKVDDDHPKVDFNTHCGRGERCDHGDNLPHHPASWEGAGRCSPGPRSPIPGEKLGVTWTKSGGRYLPPWT